MYFPDRGRVPYAMHLYGYATAYRDLPWCSAIVFSSALKPLESNFHTIVQDAEGDAENARHEIAGHENAAPCCRGGKCET